MEAIQLQIPKQFADIIVVDREEKIVLLVEVKANKIQIKSAISQLKSYLSKLKKDIDFAMLGNLEEIQIFKVSDNNDMELKISLKTVDILSYYDAEFGEKKIFSLYLTTLLEAWLRDLAYHWKSKTPPASKELAKIGLLEKIEGGDTYSQVNIGNI